MTPEPPRDMPPEFVDIVKRALEEEQSSAANPSCGTCRWMMPVGSGLYAGLCRYNPPQVIMQKVTVSGETEQVAISFCPGVQMDWECAHWKPSRKDT